MNSDSLWQADPAALTLLAPMTDVHGYALRPPLGYTLSSVEDKFAHTYTWQGVSRDAGSAPEMIVVVIPPVLGIAVTQPDRAIGCYMREVRHNVLSVSEEPTQQGRVDGRLFWRAAWHGTAGAPNGSIAVRGFVYATREQGAVILIGGHDASPYADQTLAVAEASALTLHRQR
jgi:hypothetical protein